MFFGRSNLCYCQLPTKQSNSPCIWAVTRSNADLVVDASGKVSKTPQWLKSLGYEPPQETAINAFVGYASRIYKCSGKLSDTAPVFVSLGPPVRTRGGAIFPIEGNRKLVSRGGGDRDYPPADEAGFLEFARSLPTPKIYAVLFHPSIAVKAIGQLVTVRHSAFSIAQN